MSIYDFFFFVEFEILLHNHKEVTGMQPRVLWLKKRSVWVYLLNLYEEFEITYCVIAFLFY